MKRKAFHFFFFMTSFFILFLSSCSSVKNRNWKDEVIIDKKYRDFAERADAYLKEAGFQGAVLIGRGDKIVFAKGYGFCDEKAETPDVSPAPAKKEAAPAKKETPAEETGAAPPEQEQQGGSRQ